MSNKLFYTLVVIGAVVLLGVGVYSLAPSIDTTQGYHESSQISVDISGVEKTLQEAINDGNFGGGDNLGNHVATQNLDAASNKIINLASPTGNSDAATKGYVDAASGGGCYTKVNTNMYSTWPPWPTCSSGFAQVDSWEYVMGSLGSASNKIYAREIACCR